MSCERPYALFAILIIIPVLLFIFLHNKKDDIRVDNQLAAHNRKIGKRRLFNYSKLSKIKALLFGLAWCMMVLSYSKIYWGTYLVPVQKNGTAVCFVFDISNSMLAKDGPKGSTRLNAATVYAKALMERMNSTPVSVVLAKGDGITAIPITEDYVMIESLLDVMSPSLMTAPGSSLGKGVLKGKDSFPSNYSNAGRIWVFTDGEETDNHLKNALTECLKAGIPVSIIGFGQEEEVDILAGDGKTSVKSALRSKKIMETIEGAQKNIPFYKNQIKNTYVNSNDRGSALSLLSQLKASNEQIVAYEAKPVPRYKLFLLLGILLFASGFLVTEFDLSRIFPDLKKLGVSSLIAGSIFFMSCSSDTGKILQGAYSFNQQQYSHAISMFLEVSEDAKAKQDNDVRDFALYDLGTTYAMLEEDEAALQKYGSIGENAPLRVQFSSFYNAGIIAHRNGNYDDAINFFKKALEIDSSNLEAKINLELSIAQAEVDVQHNKSDESIPAQEEQNSAPEMENAIFQRIKENDQKQWKSNESSSDQNLAGDY